MDTAVSSHWVKDKPSVHRALLIMAGVGFGFFILLALFGSPEIAWLIYLVNFLIFTAVSLGALLFSTIMQFTRAKWSHSLAVVAEAFCSFFPVSLLLFLLLFAGQHYVFPWIGQDLHGKEVWLNVPFLFLRDFIGLLILFGLGLVYTYYSLWYRLKNHQTDTRFKTILLERWAKKNLDPEQIKSRKTFAAGFYMFAFAMVLSMIGFDLVMSMDPHWYSTLFGGYSFIKAIYMAIGGLILLLCLLHLSRSLPFSLKPSQLQDIATLFFGFSIVWGDFFYSQFVVIWYGNISEETAYIIERTMTPPWNGFAWTVFLICFILPFLFLLSRKIKQNPKLMAGFCTLVLTGFWLEHFLLLGPNYIHNGNLFFVGISALIITPGFLALMVMALRAYIRQFPEVLDTEFGEVVQWK